MIYHGTANIENIIVHPYDNIRNFQVVSLTKYPDAPFFSVEVDDGEDVWMWEFEQNNNSDYERVKINIFDAIYDTDSMVELAERLDDIFTDGFADILVEDDCDGDCEHCPHRDEE